MKGQENNSRIVDKSTSNIDNKSYNVLLDDAKQIIGTSRQQAYSSINVLMVRRNWYLGKRIVEEELRGERRAEYGAQVIKRLSEDLTQYYGKGFTKTNLYAFTQFYNYFPEIFHTVCGKSKNENLDTVCLNSNKGILDTVSPKSQGLLSWSHYRTLLQVDDKAARDWYGKETFATRKKLKIVGRQIIDESVSEKMVDKRSLQEKKVDKWSIKPSLAEKLVDILGSAWEKQKQNL